jgi:hypothetical protein
VSRGKHRVAVAALALAALAVGVAIAPAGRAQSPCVVTGPQWVLDNGLAGAQHTVIKGTRYEVTLAALGRAKPPTCAFARAWLPKLQRLNRTTTPLGRRKLVGGPPGYTCSGMTSPPPIINLIGGTCKKYTARTSGGGDGNAFVWRPLPPVS